MRYAFLSLLLLGACERRHQLTEGTQHGHFVVSCCQDNVNNVLSYPAFLPEGQVQLCNAAEKACAVSGCHLNGAIYLPMHVDCGRTPYKVGDSYYPPTGY